MSDTRSLLGYRDCREVLERAVSSERGLKIEFETEAAARVFVRRCNHFRVLDRKENAKNMPDGHELHGNSVYDILRIGAKDNFVTIAVLKDEILNIEDL